MIKPLEKTESVAVIGASNDPKKLGSLIVSNLRKYGYTGHIYPVNLSDTEIQGLRAYAHIGDIAEQVDMAVIAIPAQYVPDALRECVKKLVPTVVIISAGFKETGEGGKALEQTLADIIKNTRTRVVGPNCLGVIVSGIGLNASFAANFPKEDSISFISQSGALGTAFLDWIDENNLGIDTFISIGNKLDVDENTLLEEFTNSKVIACYLEDIKDGKKMMKMGYMYNKRRPVIVLKPGKTDAAAKAIASHTGALAGGHYVISTALKQSGYIEVDTIGDMFSKIKAFAWQPIPKNNKVAIITNAGGPAVITTDLLIEHGLELASLSERTHDLLASTLPREANLHNPIDVIGDALADRYLSAMEAVLKEPEVSSLIVLLTPQVMTEIEKTARYIGDMKKYNKPILASFIGGTLVEKGIKLLSQEKIPAYHFPETAVDVLASMADYATYLNKPDSPVHIHPYGNSSYYAKNHLNIYEYYTRAQKEGLKAFSPLVAEDVAKRYGIAVPESFTCASVEEALSHIHDHVGFPCVLKISSPELIHKSDIGGVIRNIQHEEELRDAYFKLEGIIQTHSIQQASIEIQKFITDGHFLIVGAQRDANFGNILLFGQGGVYTEIIRDVSRRISPASEQDIHDMIEETTIAKILHGVRGEEPIDLSPIVRTIQSVQALMEDYNFISSIDINPLIVSEDGIYAVDIKILL